MTAPADRIRAAAALLREMAAKATPGPWMALEVDRLGFVLSPDEDAEDERRRVVVCGTKLPADRRGALRLPGTYEPQHLLIEVETDQINDDQEAEHWASMQWIALLGPDKAEHLAAWLDTHAIWADDVQRGFFPPSEVAVIDAERWPGLAAALAFADSLLKDTP